MFRLNMYMQALRRNWWIVLVTAVAAVLAVLILDFATQPVYRTRLQLLVVPNMAEFEGRDLIYSLNTLGQRSIAATYVEVVNSNRIRREAIASANPEPGTGNNYHIRAVALPEANVIEVTAEGPDPDVTAAMATAAAESTIQYVNSTYDIYRIELLDPATVPLSPISPTPWQDATLALIAGLVLGCVLAVLRDQMRQPLTEVLQQWNAQDHASTTYTRSYLLHRLSQLLAGETALGVGIVRLEGLYDLYLPPSVNKDLLRRVVARMREELRGRDLIGRWDDASFAIVLPHLHTLEDVRARLDALQGVLAQPVEIYPGGEVVNLSPRIGAVLNQQEDTTAALIERLETAVSRASKNGHEPYLYRQELETEA